MNPKLIVGAGLTGLIAAHAWPRAQIIDQSPEPAPGGNHRALLRFRSDAVSTLTGVPFRKVQVRKGIWHGDGFVSPDIRIANIYAQKVLSGNLAGERSIWSLEPVERYIAPDNFYELLLANVGDRISWNTSLTWEVRVIDKKPERSDVPVISTMPLPNLIDTLQMPLHARAMEDSLSAPINVHRYKLADVDVYQTVYFPDLRHGCYRASITGDTLIVECMSELPWRDRNLDDVLNAFGLDAASISRAEAVSQQRYGKIAPMTDDNLRKELIFQITEQANIYSLGRFAVWKNILLDDVVKDINAIKAQIAMRSGYDRRRTAP